MLYQSLLGRGNIEEHSTAFLDITSYSTARMPAAARTSYKPKQELWRAAKISIVTTQNRQYS
jgi:hypothetical protein